ncbi:alpha gamma adaptin-binding p34 [Pyrrhoderma noxium]|uniref:Alpha gamma adaptin-binding p34 n=1 Tax=Pyrrhoderma noxium TaxID=2282107 RepID=A0A286UC77_9AGAM|nr:alpha gamma adaptin-binding p34 [Pyrrhoderma noxium]
MSSEDSSSSTSASCRIVVVSSSLETAKQVAHRIKAVSGDTQPSSSPSSEIIHWTIKNKYYTAPVHFHPIHLEGLPSIELDEVPAIIYAWKENEPYKEHMKLVSEQTATFKPEVSLAVNMAPTTDEDLEDFFFEHGFEYVSGQQIQSGEQSPGLADSSTVPGITRAVDSLSTIMWPSMVRNEPKNPKFAAKLTLPPEGDDIDAHLLSLLSDSGGQSNKQHQMELLERWLEQDNDDDESLGTYSRGIRHGNNNDDYDDYASLYSHAHSVSTTAAKSDDPWATGVGGGGFSLSDTLESDQHIGFDDDFTDFVSAPAAVTGRQENEERDEDEDEDEDAGLPSREEIRAAGARIFGERMSIPESGSAPFYVLPDEPEHGNRNLDGDGGAEETEEGLEMDAPAFDLTRILGALEGMKEEIAQISDEQERRRAAAKVTLGLVYGLENMGDETADNK